MLGCYEPTFSWTFSPPLGSLASWSGADPPAQTVSAPRCTSTTLVSTTAECGTRSTTCPIVTPACGVLAVTQAGTSPPDPGKFVVNCSSPCGSGDMVATVTFAGVTPCCSSPTVSDLSCALTIAYPGGGSQLLAPYSSTAATNGGALVVTMLVKDDCVINALRTIGSSQPAVRCQNMSNVTLTPSIGATIHCGLCSTRLVATSGLPIDGKLRCTSNSCSYSTPACNCP